MRRLPQDGDMDRGDQGRPPVDLLVRPRSASYLRLIETLNQRLPQQLLRAVEQASRLGVSVPADRHPKLVKHTGVSASGTAFGPRVPGPSR